MHDIKSIREDGAAFDRALARRGVEPVSAAILAIDEQRRAAQTELNELQAKRNEASKNIGKVKKEGGDAQSLIDEVAAIKGRLADLAEHMKRLAEEQDGLLATVPNVPAANTPDGLSEDENVEQRRVGEPRTFDFEPKDHVALGEGLGLMDFEGAAALSGARFVVLKGALARLERALAQFMLDLQTGEHGYVWHRTTAEVRRRPVRNPGNAAFGRRPAEPYRPGRGHGSGARSSQRRGQGRGR